MAKVQEHKRLSSAAVKIQCQYRKIALEERVARRLLERQSSAASSIQNGWRNRQASSGSFARMGSILGAALAANGKDGPKSSSKSESAMAELERKKRERSVAHEKRQKVPVRLPIAALSPDWLRDQFRRFALLLSLLRYLSVVGSPFALAWSSSSRGSAQRYACKVSVDQ